MSARKDISLKERKRRINGKKRLRRKRMSGGGLVGRSLFLKKGRVV